MSGAPKLTWSRSSSVQFPQIWRIFMARDVKSDDLVEYRVQDLPTDRIDDAVQHMLTYYLKDDPVSQALGELIIVWWHFKIDENSNFGSNQLQNRWTEFF